MFPQYSSTAKQERPDRTSRIPEYIPYAELNSIPCVCLPGTRHRINDSEDTFRCNSLTERLSIPIHNEPTVRQYMPQSVQHQLPVFPTIQQDPTAVKVPRLTGSYRYRVPLMIQCRHHTAAGYPNGYTSAALQDLRKGLSMFIT